MARLAIVLAVLGFAYWHCCGQGRKSTAALEADRIKANAAIMQQCINQEQRLQSAGGLGDVGPSGADAERLCAEKNGLVKRDGVWHTR